MFVERTRPAFQIRALSGGPCVCSPRDRAGAAQTGDSCMAAGLMHDGGRPQYCEPGIASPGVALAVRSFSVIICRPQQRARDHAS